MEQIISFISNNYEWLFGGIGVVAIGALIKFFWKKDKDTTIKQKQKSGDSSKNIQIGQINNEKDD